MEHTDSGLWAVKKLQNICWRLAESQWMSHIHTEATKRSSIVHNGSLSPQRWRCWELELGGDKNETIWECWENNACVIFFNILPFILQIGDFTSIHPHRCTVYCYTIARWTTTLKLLTSNVNDTESLLTEAVRMWDILGNKRTIRFWSWCRGSGKNGRVWGEGWLWQGQNCEHTFKLAGVVRCSR